MLSFFESGEKDLNQVDINCSSLYSNYVKFLLSLELGKNDIIPEKIHELKSFGGKDIFKFTYLDSQFKMVSSCT